MSQYLVTGGTGFVGRWVAAGLVAAGHQVRVFDARPNPAALEDARPGLSDLVELITGDISDGSVRAAAEGCDGIVHLAGVMTVEAAADPIRAAQINLIGSLHVFEAAKALGGLPVVYASTAGVFGPDDATHPRPMTHYGAQKLAVEGTARAYHADHGQPSIGFRPYIVYGPGQSSGIAAGPSIALSAAFAGEPATIRFSGRVGFVHVFDVAALMIAALTGPMTGPMTGAECYTLCGETTEMDRFVERLKDRHPGAEIDVEGPPLRIPAELSTDPLPDHLAALGVTSLTNGIDATLAHYAARAQSESAA